VELTLFRAPGKLSDRQYIAQGLRSVIDYFSLFALRTMYLEILAFWIGVDGLSSNQTTSESLRLSAEK
jgi:hypothetical protein